MQGQADCTPLIASRITTPTRHPSRTGRAGPPIPIIRQLTSNGTASSNFQLSLANLDTRVAPLPCSACHDLRREAEKGANANFRWNPSTVRLLRVATGQNRPPRIRRVGDSQHMHANPVKRKLVRNPSAWMWSSASFYATGVPGMIPVDPVP